MPDYQNGKIYKLVNSRNNQVYIGSTTRPLTVRYNGHVGDSKRYTTRINLAIRKIGGEHFRIKLIKHFPCNSKVDLEKEEMRTVAKYLNNGYELYNTTVEYGKMSEVQKNKLRGQKRTEETKEKNRQNNLNMSKETRAKIGAAFFQRGCVYFDKIQNQWKFMWRVEGTRSKSKTFAVRKYGAKAAERLANAYRDIIFPL